MSASVGGIEGRVNENMVRHPWVCTGECWYFCAGLVVWRYEAIYSIQINAYFGWSGGPWWYGELCQRFCERITWLFSAVLSSRAGRDLRMRGSPCCPFEHVYGDQNNRLHGPRRY